MHEPLGARPPAFLLKPIYLAKPWGGRRLETELRRDDVPRGTVGESWEAVDLPEVESVVDGGPLAGATLREAYGRAFPLLLKVIDARENLSVQVHPDGRDGAPAKEEAWVALGAGALVAWGPVGTPLPGPGAWLARLERKALRPPGRDEAAAPTLVHVPPGTVHAILGGSLLFEVQTPVDVTWRLDDYGRAGLDGRPRPLHLDEAREVLRRGPEPLGRVEDGGRRLVGKRFWLRAAPPGRVTGDLGCAAFLPRGGTAAWSGPQGAGRLDVPPGRTVVLAGGLASLESPGWTLLAGVP
jgi:mannose-6-phosphate isomerase